MINDNIVIMLRAVINDLDSETYTDSRLDQIIAVAANYVIMDLNSTTYTVDVASPTITPDPYPDDQSFVNLIVMYSACMLDQGVFRNKALLAGLEAKCGPAVLKTTGHLDGFKALLASGPCALYKEMIRDYKLGSGELCHAILSPFVSDNFDPQNFGYPDAERFIR